VPDHYLSEQLHHAPHAEPVRYAPPADHVRYAPPADPVRYAPPADLERYAPPEPVNHTSSLHDPYQHSYYNEDVLPAEWYSPILQRILG
jgi:hypothetical protein